MSIETIILIESESIESASLNTFSYSDKKLGVGYHRRDGGLHTIQFELNNFKGSIKIQGTLEIYPGHDDWVDLDFDSGSPLESLDSTSMTTNTTKNITGNWVWIRAAWVLEQGTITRIRYNL
jgi:hypothetical protein